MTSPATGLPRGRLEMLVLDSALLAGNPLGDPTSRHLPVYLPAGHEDGTGLPLLVDLAAYTSSGLAHIGWKNFGENLPERLDRLIASGVLPPVVVAFPDAFTRLGGNQYVDSPGIGNYGRYITEEVVPTVETRFGCGGVGRRGCFGKSSGGYGALWLAHHHPGIFSAVACHAGDMAFELSYLPDFTDALVELAAHANDPHSFISAFWQNDKPSGQAIHTLMVLCMAATYDPDPKNPTHIRLPVDPWTAEVIPDRWEQWLAHDPLRFVEANPEPMSQLKALVIDCGDRDEYRLQFGARRFHRLLRDSGIAHVYEEFSGSHSGLDFRLDTSLPILANALA